MPPSAISSGLRHLSFHPLRPSSSSGYRNQALLQAYFRSGWAFLIPYFAAYLLYAWLKWPANPTDADRWTGLPALLHVYWFLHGIHLVLGAVALRLWWRDTGAPAAKSARCSLDVGYRLLPWICLAAIFWIPGIYLEWPSDPWEHLRRINEWHAHDIVTAHSIWWKSSYFLPYSLTGHATGLAQYAWLNFYYTLICLLLSWQYYRLARAVGLGERAAMVFTLLSALTFGNSIFSFYRYYGLSSSIYAQLGAVALTRIALEVFGTSCAEPQVTADWWPASPARAWSHPLLRLTAAGLALVPLIAFNHVQGLGIAGLGVGAVLTWRLVRTRPSAIWWLLGGMILINALVLWLYPRPTFVEAYRAQGWLSSWYGFNLLDSASPANAQALRIAGPVGLVSIFASIFLLRRNHVSAWLTLAPLVILLMPAFALPFATVVGNKHAADIVTFSRMLLAAPFALAIVTGSVAVLTTPRLARIAFHAVVGTVCLLSLPLLATASSGAGAYARVWHSLMRLPKDLSLDPIVQAVADGAERSGGAESVMTTSIPAFVVQMQRPGRSLAWGASARHYALTGRNPVDDPPAVENVAISSFTMQHAGILLFRPTLFSSGSSQAAIMSRHWPPNEVMLAASGTPEMERFCASKGLRSMPHAHWIWYRAADRSQGDQPWGPASSNHVPAGRSDR